MSEVYFKHPGLGGRRVAIQGFKLDDGNLRCELCNKVVSNEQLGTLTIKDLNTGKSETHKVCLECGKKLARG